jgi:ABC-type polysaccharide/polyol phosphate transport system ATPase subunit
VAVPLTVTQQGASPPVTPPAAPPAVTVEHLSKRFALPHRHYSTLKERALHPFAGRSMDVLEAVQDASFTVAPGEFFGIVGRNGSGKSTLLKCLAGIYEVDAGHAVVRGRLSPFIELGVGFNPDLTARDNVIINAIMLGLTRREARARFDDIIAFAELEEFLDLKLKNYSSGMSVRLAFSVAIQVDADVLLVDEVLAVGDVAFQQKCFEQFHRLKDEGKTIILVTHDMSSIERFCDRALLLERGRIVSIDEPHAIARAYNELNFGRIVTPQAPGEERYGTHEAAEIKAAWFERPSGERATTVAVGDPVAMCVEVAFHAPLEDPWFSLHLRNEARHTVFATGSTAHVANSGRFAAGESVVVRVALDNWFAPGRYELTPTVARAGGADVLDLREDLATLVVHGTRHLGGIIEVPHTFEIERT